MFEVPAAPIMKFKSY